MPGMTSAVGGKKSTAALGGYFNLTIEPKNPMDGSVSILEKSRSYVGQPG